MSSLAVPVAVNTSLSRKRSHDQITRSETRSVSPEPVPKRRRIQASSDLNSSPTPRPPRFIGDGFDYRRPVMSNRNRTPGLIDLTMDEEVASFPEAEGLGLSPDVYESAFFQVSGDDDPESISNASEPPHSPARHAQLIPIIDLSDDDVNTEEDPVPAARRDSTSSDIVFLAERAVTPVAARPQPRRPSIRSRRPTPGPHVLRDPPALVAPPPMPGLRIPELIRRGARSILGYAPPFLQPHPEHRAIIADIEGDIDDEFEVLEMDYRQAAFNMGNRDSETPQATPGAAYQEPPPVPQGFAADIEEDGVYLCPRCEEELATGSEEKQQIWVVKQCGHVYCGDCARARAFKSGTKKDKKLASKSTQSEDAFRNCVVDGCNIKVDTKDAMILVYF